MNGISLIARTRTARKEQSVGGGREPVADETPVVDKRNSLNRSSVRFERGRRVTVTSAAASGSISEEEKADDVENDAPETESPTAHHSVTLVDKPMED